MDVFQLRRRFSRAAVSFLGSSTSSHFREKHDAKVSAIVQADGKEEIVYHHSQVHFSNTQVGVSIYKLGNERAAQDKWSEALLAWQNALEIFNASLGPKHVYVARALNKIGVAYYMLQEPYYAYISFENALALQQEILPPGDEQITRTLRNMHNLLSDIREGTGSDISGEEEEGSDDETKTQFAGGTGTQKSTHRSFANTSITFKERREERSEERCY